VNFKGSEVYLLQDIAHDTCKVVIEPTLNFTFTV